MTNYLVQIDSQMIKADDINNAWRDLLWCCARKGYTTIVNKGSYEGQQRKQLDYVVVIIQTPYQRPLAPIMPEGTGIPSPTSESKIHKYFFDYLITDKNDTEQYTYGHYIAPQINKIIDILNQSDGKTNQACITIGDKNSIKLIDPPCLKVIDFKIVHKWLEMHVYFRSWDIFAGFPENIGGLQLLKEYILMHLNLSYEISDGAIYAYSSGAHIYEQYFPLVNQLNVNDIIL